MAEKRVYIAPSILSADFANLECAIKMLESAGADMVHIDVMDGVFVPNITIGPVVIKDIRKVTALPFDVHLMITDPIRYVEDFINAGADIVTVHYEAAGNISETLCMIKDKGKKAGISIKPKTKIDDKFAALYDTLDLILVMSVEPGFGGQKFMPEVLPKVEDIRSNFKGLISIDGGINDVTAKQALDAGVDILVAGSYLFKAGNMREALNKLKE